MEYKEIIYKPSTVWYLRKNLGSKQQNLLSSQLHCILQTNIEPKDYLKLYLAIGGQWDWTGRLIMSSKELDSVLKDPNHKIYYTYDNQELIGYFEFDFSSTEAEIVYFGILPEFYGKGYGSKMMHLAFNQLIKDNKASVFLHTCSNDSPNALSFYKKMSFKIFDEKIENQAIIIY